MQVLQNVPKPSIFQKLNKIVLQKFEILFIKVDRSFFQLFHFSLFYTLYNLHLFRYTKPMFNSFVSLDIHMYRQSVVAKNLPFSLSKFLYQYIPVCLSWSIDLKSGTTSIFRIYLHQREFHITFLQFDIFLCVRALCFLNKICIFCIAYIYSLWMKLILETID